jgi:diguanylate cyclase (GGDEF)-like protein
VSLSLLLLWFPVVLAVGVGGRLLDRGRGAALGLLCAMFWTVLAAVSTDSLLWSSGLSAAGWLVGAATIVLVGAWSGEHAVGAGGMTSRRRSAESGRASPLPAMTEEDTSTCVLVASTLARFEDWLEQHCVELDPWPRFQEFLRGFLFEAVGARHVRLFRLFDEGQELIPLHGSGGADAAERVSAREGIIGHVVTTGRSFVWGDPRHGDLVAQLASQGDSPPAWCFPVRRGSRRLGVIRVGQLDHDPRAVGERVRVVERVATLMWVMLDEAVRGFAARMHDAVSLMLNREAFMRIGEETVEDAYRLGEPIALAVVTLERLRALNDSGRWESADELVREVAELIRKKVRSDDVLGRFDGSRFLVLMRRVDSELARLILQQLVGRLATVCGDRSRWRATIDVRAGLAGSGTDTPTLRTLISRAIGHCHRARETEQTLCSDVDRATKEPVGAG